MKVVVTSRTDTSHGLCFHWPTKVPSLLFLRQGLCVAQASPGVVAGLRIPSENWEY